MSKIQKVLQLHELYSRKDVHDIFDPTSNFKPGTGTWGIQGIVKVPNREADYVFFVTFGQKQDTHSFVEDITTDGVLTWQSQPRQTLQDKRIQDFINHNHTSNNIYLFLRKRRLNPLTKKAELFEYYGRLAYLTHNTDMECPVYFKFQLLDWISYNVEDKDLLNRQLSNNSLTETPIPSVNKRKIHTVREFSGRYIDFDEANTKNAIIGRNGEVLVLKKEKEYLSAMGREDLAEQVSHISIVEGDGAGYDIKSFNLDGSIKYIEVKTTKLGASTPFFLTANELSFSKTNQDNYYLYRVYNFNEVTNSALFYVHIGELDELYLMEPTQYKLSIKP
ncbi:DUF3427 domain-containing protein [Paenibacillus popilliae]|uniref:DUF3427 domain-containing protein n=1 Tax=Paenibacillus popilliae TaxID=78057 RepID=A0ABY3AQ98_PAEPP|nr:DUF3427 domain-containing protein [Paenibacillus sp. SDF0028]TQR44893.1 DUF3427 domain-containing protein [Paenibacillus sp. SDF0028]